MRQRWRKISIIPALVWLCIGATPAPASSAGPGTLELFLKVFPDTKSIGLIYSDEKREQGIAELKKRAAKHKVDFISIHIPSYEEFPKALNDLKEKADTVWVPDDPLYSDVEAWKYFIMFTLRHKIKTVVPDQKALELGGLFYCTEEMEAVVNKRVLDLMGLKADTEAVAVRFYGGD